MDASIVTAVAGLTGAAIGGFTSVLASWLTQHAQAKAQRLEQDQLRRQEIYKEFIKDAAKLYIDALQSDKADVSALMGLYAEVSRALRAHLRLPIVTRYSRGMATPTSAINFSM